MRSYRFSGGYSSLFSAMRAKLNAAGWTETAADSVVLLFCTLGKNAMYDKSIYSVKCQWQNLITEDAKERITNKQKLHEEPRGYLAATKNFADFLYDMRPWIIRPAGKGFFAGRGVKIIDSEDSWIEARRYYPSLNNVIATVILRDPVLFHGRKSHIRMYLFCGKTVEFSPIGEIITAAESYIPSDWTNPSIHDSHSKSTDSLHIYPDDFPLPEYTWFIKMQLKQIAIDLAKNITPQPYSQAENAFEIFGADVMILQNGVVKILEINAKFGEPGFTADPQNEEFNLRLADWIVPMMLKEISG